MQVKKPDFKIFAGGAEDGELHDFPDVARGWGVTKLQTNKKPPLSWMNGAFNRVDNNFYYLLQNGLVEWNPEIEYSANALSQVDGVIYRAKEASKGESPAASAKWERLFADKVGTSDFIGMSQNAVKKELDKKFSAADLTQTITSDKLKAPSNFAVNTALKEKDPQKWGVGTPVRIADGTDLNDMLLPGFYTWWGATVKNAPLGYNFGFLNVYMWGAAATNGGIWQICGESKLGGQLYYRWKNTLSSEFSEWGKIYSSTNTSIDPNGVLTTKQDTVTLTTNDLAKETGNSHSKVMSQKAVSDLFNRNIDIEFKDNSLDVSYTNDSGRGKLVCVTIEAAKVGDGVDGIIHVKPVGESVGKTVASARALGADPFKTSVSLVAIVPVDAVIAVSTYTGGVLVRWVEYSL